MERYCGIIQRHIKNRRFPFANIDTFAVANARLAHIGLKYNIADILTLKAPRTEFNRGAVVLPDASCTYHYTVFWHLQLKPSTNCSSHYSDNGRILLPPHRPRNSDVDQQLLRRVRVHLVTRYKVRPAIADSYVSKENIEIFGKVKYLGGGDTMIASSLGVRATDDRRDASWIRVSACITPEA